MNPTYNLQCCHNKLQCKFMKLNNIQKKVSKVFKVLNSKIQMRAKVTQHTTGMIMIGPKHHKDDFNQQVVRPQTATQPHIT